MFSEFTQNTINKITINQLFINKLFIKKIKSIRSEIINMEEVKYTYSSTQISNKLINTLKSSPWVSNKLSYDYLLYDFNIKWNNNNNIYIKCTEQKFNCFVNRLPIFLKILNFINRENDNNITIYLILSNLKKNINKYEIISPEHINSGYTHILTKLIFIWREEEFEKVCFHEVIHLVNNDHRHEHIDIKTNIEGPTSYFEAITDFKAIILNIIYLSIITKIKIKILFTFEYYFIRNQSSYIYNILNIINKQNTPAYSYFVLKYFIFKYFNRSNFNEKLFDELFYKNKNFEILLNNIKDYKITFNNYINYNSARMTLFELK